MFCFQYIKVSNVSHNSSCYFSENKQNWTSLKLFLHFRCLKANFNGSYSEYNILWWHFWCNYDFEVFGRHVGAPKWGTKMAAPYISY